MELFQIVLVITVQNRDGLLKIALLSLTLNDHAPITEEEGHCF